MKLEVTKKDENILNLLNNIIKKDKPYLLEFKVMDLAKASLFLENLFYNSFEGLDLEKDAGILITRLDLIHRSD